ncbi:MAG: murein biosynthesis integral membrane protein MurJ [Nitrospinae bacterium]|nr:murein biosynthesis integral membrane protein MurJ [Nitrospinota bacterium]
MSTTSDPASPTPQRSAKESVTRAAGVVGFATLLSRILGYARDMIIADLFGAKAAADAFFVAFRIPSLLRRLTAEGALSAAFVPVYTETRATGKGAEAFLLVSNILTILTTLLIGVTLVGEWFAPELVTLIAPGFTDDEETFALTVTLTRITLPYIIFISMAAVVMGTLNAHGRFFAPAAAPALLNVAIIACAYLLADRLAHPAMALAVGVVIGGMLHLGAQLIPLFRLGYRYRPRFDLKDAATRKIGLLMGPGVAGLAVAELNVIVDTLLASLLPQGAVSYLYYGNRITQFPTGVFGAAIGVAALPSMASAMMAGGAEKLRELVSHTVRLSMFVSIPSTVGLIVLAEPIINVLFERGQFGPADRAGAASALICYSVGLVAFSGVKGLVAAFYALKDTATPTKIASLSMLVNIGLNLLLMGPMAHGGLALATSLASFLNMGLLALLLRWRIAGIDGRRIALSTLQMSLAAVLMGGAVYGYITLFYVYDAPALARAGHLTLSIMIGLVVYYYAAVLLGCREAHAVRDRLGARLRRKK